MPETRLVAKLKGTSTISAIVGTRVYPMIRPQNAALPCIVWEISGDRPSNYAGGTSGTSEMSIALDCIASTYAGAKALGDLVASTMSGFADSAGCVWHLENQNDVAGPIGGGTEEPEFYTVSQDYTVWHGS
jgi:hypothetical protein